MHPRNSPHIFLPAGNEWADRFGYSRAVKIGPHVAMAGVVAIDNDGTTTSPDHAGRQATRCYEIVHAALRRLGLDKRAVVRSRAFVTDISRAAEVGDAHAAFFKQHKPCLTMVEVSRLVRDDLVVEIEIDAIDPEPFARGD